MKRAVAVAALALTLTLALGACGTPVPQSTPVPTSIDRTSGGKGG